MRKSFFNKVDGEIKEVFYDDPASHTRVELHPATDAWMQGDRYGDIKQRMDNGDLIVRLDKSGTLARVEPRNILKEF